ncbi:uncharacterized protein LOC131650483 [Vicia villosa]|uniref:uncharacterized protein LOC131650483 n=1 Tax=Vicia villosa TaxID=3911 RepID=UPI00273AC21F|nr:uncharacterized protein LOC131650483 [Vicia villosa]
MTIEVIWKNRNNIVWNNDREGFSRMGLQAFFNWQEWFTAQDNQNRSSNAHTPVNWSPPSEGWVKCNVDAGFNKTYRSTNRGWCFRDAMGRFIMTGIAWDIGNLSPLEAEALALKEAVQHAVSLNMNCVIFESDSQLVSKANMVADSLVKAANSRSRRNIFNVIPPCNEVHLINDMS